jgi:hypothetical protein
MIHYCDLDEVSYRINRGREAGPGVGSLETKKNEYRTRNIE